MNQRPNLRRQIAIEILKRKAVSVNKVALIGIRGYFEDSMGRPDENDRGMYDDAFFALGPGGEYRSFNGNTDPSAKWKLRLAQLMPGVWQYQKGDHHASLAKSNPRRYPAYIQAAEVTVKRDGVAAPDTGYFGINIHRGGSESTSSLGCQTIPPDQWDEFKAFLDGLLSRHGQSKFPYVLIDNSEHERIVSESTNGDDWEVKLPNSTIFTPSRVAENGRPIVPIRAFSLALGGTVNWDGNPIVNQKELKWFWLDGNVAWGLVREICDACGKSFELSGKTITIA